MREQPKYDVYAPLFTFTAISVASIRVIGHLYLTIGALASLVVIMEMGFTYEVPVRHSVIPEVRLNVITIGLVVGIALQSSLVWAACIILHGIARRLGVGATTPGNHHDE